MLGTKVLLQLLKKLKKIKKFNQALVLQEFLFGFAASFVNSVKQILNR
jgi:hypothetical protein